MTNDQQQFSTSTSKSMQDTDKKKQPKKPRISRKKLCEAISNFTDYHKYEVEDIIKALPIVMTDLLMSGARVKIDGLGTFYIKKGATRTFKSSIDGKEHTVVTRDTICLKPDDEAKRMLNTSAAGDNTQAKE